MSRLTRITPLILPQGPDFSKYYLYHDFQNKPNGAVGMPDFGSAWTNTSAYQILDGSLMGVSGYQITKLLNTVGSTSYKIEMEAQGGNYAGLYVSYVDDNNFVHILLGQNAGGDEIRLFRMAGGNQQRIWTKNLTGFQLRKLRIQVSNASFSVYCDGIFQNSYDNSGYFQGTNKVGVLGMTNDPALLHINYVFVEK